MYSVFIKEAKASAKHWLASSFLWINCKPHLGRKPRPGHSVEAGAAVHAIQQVVGHVRPAANVVVVSKTGKTNWYRVKKYFQHLLALFHVARTNHNFYVL